MTGIFYGSTMGTTESVAQDIAQQLGVSVSDIHNVAEASVDDVDQYDMILFGTSTWGCGELQDDWFDFLEALKAKDLSGKKVALFGCGDSASYPDTFCDGIGLLYEGLQSTGCTFVGDFVPEGYDVTTSLVCNDGRFVGLAIDESNPDATDERIANWCANLK